MAIAEESQTDSSKFKSAEDIRRAILNDPSDPDAYREIATWTRKDNFRAPRCWWIRSWGPVVAPYDVELQRVRILSKLHILRTTGKDECIKKEIAFYSRYNSEIEKIYSAFIDMNEERYSDACEKFSSSISDILYIGGRNLRNTPYNSLTDTERYKRYFSPPQFAKIRIATSSDSKYFEYYAENFLNLLKKERDDSEKSISLHFHLINPTQESKILINTIKEKHADFTPTFTFDLAENPTVSVFAAARYSILPSLLEASETVIISDINSLPSAKLINKAAESQAFDARLYLRKRFFPWHVINARLAIFHRTDCGMFLANSIKKHVDTHLSHTPDWMLDQAALFKAWLECRDRVAIENLEESDAPMPQDFTPKEMLLSSEHAPGET